MISIYMHAVELHTTLDRIHEAAQEHKQVIYMYEYLDVNIIYLDVNIISRCEYYIYIHGLGRAIHDAGPHPRGSARARAGMSRP